MHNESDGVPNSSRVDSGIMDPGLKQDIKDLENKLENVRMSDVDDRSEFGFS